MTKTRRMRVALVTSASLLALVAQGCGGGDDFDNEPRPPIPLQLTGVITESSVTVSPSRLGAGPIILTVSNQTSRSHTLTLEGEGVREPVGPINPLDTAVIQKTLKPGIYEVKAGSPSAAPEMIEPGILRIGPERDTSSDDLLLP